MSYCTSGKIEKTDIYECIVYRHLKSTHKYAIYKYRRNGKGTLEIHSICINYLIIWFLLWVFHILTDFYVDGGGRRYANLLTKIDETNLTERSATKRTNTWRF